MRKVTKIVAVVMVVILLSDRVVYAGPVWNFLKKSVYQDRVCPAGRFLKKSVYQDRIYGWGYKKVIEKDLTLGPMIKQFRRDISTLKNTAGSATWWTSSGWSKYVQRNRNWIGGGSLPFTGLGMMATSVLVFSIGGPIGIALFGLGAVSFYGGVYFMGQIKKSEEAQGRH